MGRTGVVWASGTALRLARRRARLSQKELAERAGVGRDQISEWERGAHKPDINSLVRLAAVLGDTPIRALLLPDAPVTVAFLRVCAGMTQRQLADKLGFSPQTWSSVELGRRPIRDEELDLIAEALAVTTTELVEAVRVTAGTPETVPEVVEISAGTQLAADIEQDRQPGETTLEVLERWAATRRGEALPPGE